MVAKRECDCNRFHESHRSSMACAVGLDSCVSLLSAGKAAAGCVAIGLQGYPVHDMNLDGLVATRQVNGHMQFVWHGIRLGSTQAPGHTHSTSLAVWHAPCTANFISSGKEYRMHCIESVLFIA